MTILFCDIRDFTTFAEERSPEKIFKFLNEFLGKMEPAISENHGFIDKYIGDAIMALFTNADDAIQAALTMQKNMISLNIKGEQESHMPFSIGIGINTGDLMLGILGGSRRIETTVIGDAVNVASRLESLTKEYKCSIIISDATKNQLENSEKYDLQQIGKVVVKGRKAPIDIWKVNNNRS